MIDQETNKTLSEFRQIPEDVEPEGETQPDSMGFETPWPGNEIGVWGGEEGNSPQQGLHQHQTEPQSEDLNITQINFHQTTETAFNDVPRIVESSKHHRPLQTEMIGENIQEQTGQVLQNHRDEYTRGAIESNTGNTANTNLNSNQHNTASNNTNILQVPEDRSEISQNYF